MQHLHPNSALQGGKYKIEKVLGQGGFGITYLAENTYVNNKVAIKEFFFKEHCERDERTCTISSATSYGSEITARFKAKFLKEARIIMNLDHPNIVKVKDVFEENGTAYYVMDYIEGCSLSEIVKYQGALSEAKALKYFKEVANALDYIHSKRINHLDVKPANIMIRREDDKAILIDFGVSKQYDAVGSQTSSTPVGISAGFAPLEQHVAGGVSQFTPQADIYSLGATLYCMLVGKNPPSANEILNAGLPSLPMNISEGTKSVIKAAMQVRKDDRPSNIKELLGKLSSKGNKRGTSLGWLVAILIAVVGGFVWNNTSKSNNENIGYENEGKGNFEQEPLEISDYIVEEVIPQKETEIPQNKPEDHDQEIKDFIHFFYSAYVFGSYEFDTSKVSSSVLRRLENDYDYDGGGYAVWDFRTGYQDGPDGESKITSISSEGNGWYKVTMLDSGVNGVKRVKVDYNNGDIKIVDFK